MNTDTGIAAATNLDDLRELLRQLYDAYRTALLNKKYYSHQLTKLRRLDLYMEVAIAIGGAGSGGVAGLAVWGSINGRYAWLSISAAAAVLSVIKPLLQLGKQIEKYAKLYSGYTGAYFELKALVDEIKRTTASPHNFEDKYKSMMQTFKELDALDESPSDKSLIGILEGDVNREIPPEILWMP